MASPSEAIIDGAVSRAEDRGSLDRDPVPTVDCPGPFRTLEESSVFAMIGAALVLAIIHPCAVDLTTTRRVATRLGILSHIGVKKFTKNFTYLKIVDLLGFSQISLHQGEPNSRKHTKPCLRQYCRVLSFVQVNS
jgi:hypothetical protein